MSTCSEILSGLTPSGSQMVRELAHAFLLSRGVNTVVGSDCLTATDGRIFGLANLASRCHNSPSDDWSDLISAHLSALLSQFPAPPEELTPEQMIAGAHLRIVLAEAIPPGWEDSYTYARRMGGGLVEMLAHRDDEMVRWMRDVEVSKVGVDELRAIGRANVAAIPHGVESLNIDGIRIHRLTGDGFTASKMLLIDELAAEITGTNEYAHGYLVMIPTRFELLFVPMKNKVADRLPVLSEFVADRFRNGVAALSPGLHWWRDGGLVG